MPPESAFFAALALAVGIAALLRSGRTGPRARSAALVAGGASFLALVLAERAAAAWPVASGVGATLRLIAGAAALIVWGAVAVLAFHGVRRRDLFWIVPFGLFSSLNLLSARPSTGMGLLLTLPVIARWRWMEGAGRRTTGLALLGALLVPLLAFLPVPGDRALPSEPGAGLMRFVAWARELAGLYLLFALPDLLKRWSVGIRRISRRLALLLLFAGVVPVVLVAFLWGATTQLGVRAERALFASRLVEQAAERLHGSLAVASSATGTGRDALSGVAAAHGRWPGLRLWRDGVRVHGASVPGEGTLAYWPDSLPQAGPVLLGDAPWLGARLAEPAGRSVLLALAPMEEVFEADIEPALDVKLAFQAQLGGDTLEPTVRSAIRQTRDGAPSPAAGDSIGWLVRRVAPDTAGIHLTVGGRRTFAARDFSFTAGHGLVGGIAFSHGRWSRMEGLLTADVRWGAIALGLSRSVRENPLNVLPLAFIGLLFSLILTVAAADFAMVGSLGRSITAAVAALREGAARFEAADLAHRIPVEGRDDLWDVAGAFNRMAVGLERARQLETERQRIEDELALARRIQARLLPPGPPQVPGVELAGAYDPAREVGGDYYDFVPLTEGRVALVIADVSGKGVGAALLMSAFRASLLSQDIAGETPARVLEHVNRFLHRSVESGKFVTAFLGVLCGRTGRLVYCNAGHNPPVVTRAGGTTERLEAGGLILGILEHSHFEVAETVLAAGDTLTLFTDGVSEAANEQDEQWGEERLIELLGETAARPCAETAARIVAEVRHFEGERGPSDDVTLIVARRAG